ncbi:NTP transferase domain-containing protein [uncultured Slackia sp.]|uniref:NTP transferase domain-containing protein n=1 Tax=uncultured Slackia sp. TaxID=665903 RepID=UPI0034A177C7
MAELCDAPLVGHVVRATDGLFSRRVVVTRHADVAALCETLGAQVILHDEPCRNDTVRLGMEAMDGCDTVTFVQGDQPLIHPVSIAALLRAAERDAAGAARRDAAGRGVANVVGCDAADVTRCDAAGAALRGAAEGGVADVAKCDAAEDCSAKSVALKCVLLKRGSVNDVVAEGAFPERGFGERGLAAFDSSQCGFPEGSVAGGVGTKGDLAGVDCDCNAVGHIWRTSFDGVAGAPVLFPSWAFDELCSLPRGKGGGFVAKMHAECVRTIEVSSEWELFDVDTRDDLRQLQTHIARCGSASLPC